MLWLALVPVCAPGAQFFVSPMGSSQASGTWNDPWDLNTAFQSVTVNPGDTVWLRGGIYGDGAETVFKSLLAGTPSHPVIIRQYPGERATINGAIQVFGPYAWYWGFEIMNTHLARYSGQAGSFPTDIPQQTGITPAASPLYPTVPGVKFINLVVHDTANGLSAFSAAPGTEIYGCLTYNNGWIGPDRGHGHGIYLQNASDTKRIRENLVFDNFDAGLHAAGSASATIQNIEMVGNVVFNNGLAGGHRVDNIIVEGSGSPLQGLSVESNYVYNPAAAVGNQGYNRVGSQFDGVNGDAVVKDNVWVGGDPGLMVANWNHVTFTGNTVFAQTDSSRNYNGQLQLRLLTGQNTSGYIWDNNTYYPAGWRLFMEYVGDAPTSGADFDSWRSATGLDAHSRVLPSAPASTWTFVRPNTYEPGRANIVVYNWSLQPSVSVDVSAAGLTLGNSYEVRDAQDYFAGPVVTGVYDGRPIPVPMTGLTIAQPMGSYPSLIHTAPEFGAFVLLPVDNTGPAPNQPPAVSAGSGGIVTLPNSFWLNGYVEDDGLPSGTLTSTWSMVAGPGAVVFADATKAITTATFSGPGIYVLRLAASDGVLTASSDASVNVLATNQAPVVSAGQNATITLPATAALSGSVQDDGAPSGKLTSTWSAVSGPGAVTFANPAAPATVASFSAAGTYNLRLTASHGALSASAEVTIIVRPANQPPTVSAGSDATVTLPAAAALNGSVQDDGLPLGTLAISWSMQSGPGVVTFSMVSAAQTTATFSAAGNYVLRLTASDGALSSSAELTITVQPPSPSSAGLAGYWTFDVLDTTAYSTRDTSGNGLNATFRGSLATEPGKVNGAMVFNGGYLSVDGDTGSTKTQLVNDLTLAVWVKTTNMTKLEGLISKYAAGVKEWGYLLRTTPAGHVGMRIGNQNLAGGSSDITDSGVKINDGAWHHVAAVIHLGQDVTFYIDGQRSSVQTAAIKAATTSVNLLIGSNGWTDYGNPFRGSLDDTRIYNRALTGLEIAGLAAQGGTTPPLTNQPPSVSAGVNATVTLPGSASLSGAVQDDGLPSGTLTSAWSVVSGPGTVVFANPGSPATTASFTAAGTYVLRLSASDGALSASADITITVLAGTVSPPATDGPAACWTFDAADTTAYRIGDHSGNHLDLTVRGTVFTGNGRSGDALVLNGAGYLTADSDITVNSGTQLVHDLSLSVWVKTTNTTRLEGLISKYAAGVTEHGYLLRVVPPGRVGVRIGNANLAGGSSDITDPTTLISDGDWHHLAVVITLGQNVAFYVDGRQTSVQPVSSKAANTSVVTWVGRNGWTDYGDLFHGSLDDARVYSRALTPQEISDLAGGTSPPAANQAPTVSAGANATVTLPNAASLSGTVQDDGLPSGSLTSTWSVVSGPGTVTVANPASAGTTAAFTEAGTYILRLTASDGALSASADVTITVLAAAITPPATDGPAAYWTFDAADTNYTIADCSGNHLDLTPRGTVSTGAGQYADALLLNGTGYLTADRDVTMNSGTQLVHDLSVAVWVKTTNTTRLEGLISKYAAGVKEYGYLLRVVPPGRVGIRIGNANLAGGSSDISDTTSIISDGNWHHLAVVIRIGIDVTFYVDGHQASVQPVLSKAANSSVVTYVGRNGWTDYGAYFHGALDDARIYGRALTAQDVAALAGIP